MHWQRQFLHPMLRAMDAPSREECIARRPRSNTPTAAMVLLNDPSFVEAARVFAARIIREGGKTEKSRLEFAWKTALSRTPDLEERNILGLLYNAAKKEYSAESAEAAALGSVGQAPKAEGVDPSELAVWTTMARAILNLGETNNRN